MDLEDHLAARQFVLEALMDLDHRDLDQIGGRALNRTIDRHALTDAALRGIAALQFRNRTAAAEDRGRIALSLAVVDIAVHQRPHSRKLLEERLDIFLGIRLRHTDVGCQAERADAIHNSEHHALRRAPHLPSHLASRQIKNLHGRGHVNVFSLFEHLQQARVLREVR